MKKMVSLLGCLMILTIGLAPSALAEKGIINKALSLDGDSDYVHVPHSDSLDISGSNLTMEAWVYLSGETGNHWVVCKQNIDSIRSYGFYINSRDQGDRRKVVPSIHADWHFEEEVGSGVLEYGSWYHVAVLYYGNQVKTYINGQFNGEANLSGELQHNQRELTIGGTYWTDSDTTDGLIDEVRIWNVARTQEQIKRWMNRRIWWHPKKLVGYWRMDDPLDSRTAKDYSGNGNDGTLMGDAHFVFAPRVQEAPSINPTRSLKTKITMTWGHLKAKH